MSATYWCLKIIDLQWHLEGIETERNESRTIWEVEGLLQWCIEINWVKNLFLNSPVGNLQIGLKNLLNWYLTKACTLCIPLGNIGSLSVPLLLFQTKCWTTSFNQDIVLCLWHSAKFMCLLASYLINFTCSLNASTFRNPSTILYISTLCWASSSWCAWS